MELDQSLLEQISALVDNECDGPELEQVIAALRDREHQRTWDIYHQIGDLLRAQKSGGADDPLLYLNAWVAGVAGVADTAPLSQTECSLNSPTLFPQITERSAELGLLPNRQWLTMSLVALLACLILLVPQGAAQDGPALNTSDTSEFLSCRSTPKAFPNIQSPSRKNHLDPGSKKVV